MISRFSGLRVFEVLTLGLAVILSVGSIWMLFQINNGLTRSQELYDDNLPSFSVKAEYELARLISALNEFMVGTSDTDNVHLRYDIFLARLNHYESAFTTVYHQPNTEVHEQIEGLLGLMLKLEEPVFALREGDVELAAIVEEALHAMYGPIEELTTITREAHNRQLEILVGNHLQGARVGFALILATFLIDALIVAYFWYNLKEKTRFNADLEMQIQQRTEDLQISNANLKKEMNERQRAEISLAEREQQIHRVQKMEAVGRVTSGVAHDFNNLLAVIMGNIELLQGSSDKELSAKYLDNALAATVMGSQITRKLLAFGRRAPLKPETVDINRVILEIDDLLVHTLPENIRLDLCLEEGIWPISVDRSLLENVLLNLVINARDALSESGCIVVNTSNVSNRNNQLQLDDQSTTVEDYVSVSIADEGTGMTVQVLDQVFEPFFSTKTESEGSGLGLSMASGFAQQSNGSIKVTSAPGKGTCVRMLFPRCFSEIDAIQSNDSNGLHNAGTARRVLVVEDLETVRQVVVDQLQMLGYDTIEASNGREALVQINADSSIDLMLSDVVMPGDLQGLELANRVKRIRPDIKILIMSGYPKGTKHSKIETSCRFNKLMKPVGLAELSRALLEEFKDSPLNLPEIETVE